MLFVNYKTTSLNDISDRPLLYRLLTFSVKRSVACVAREIQSAALEIWRSHAILQYYYYYYL